MLRFPSWNGRGKVYLRAMEEGYALRHASTVACVCSIRRERYLRRLTYGGGRKGIIHDHSRIFHVYPSIPDLCFNRPDEINAFLPFALRKLTYDILPRTKFYPAQLVDSRDLALVKHAPMWFRSILLVPSGCTRLRQAGKPWWRQNISTCHFSSSRW